MINNKVKKSILSSDNPDNSIKYNYAGSFFTDQKLVLCGYQQNKKIPNLSGFGGKKEDIDKTYIETAIRETIEELFDIKPDRDTIKYINHNVIYKRLVIQNNYYMLVYTFDDLEIMLDILHKKEITSKLYTDFPKTISELIFNRNFNVKSEISYLCLLPLKENISINFELIQDINSVLIHK